MMKLVLAGICAAALTAGLVVAGPVSANNGPPEAPPNAQITFLAELPHRGAALERAAKAISTPGNPQFRKYVTLQQAAQEFGATDAQIAKMRKVVQARGLRAVVDPSKLVVRLTGSVETWEKLMGQPVQYQPPQPGNPYHSYDFQIQENALPRVGDPRLWDVYSALLSESLAGVPASLRGAVTRIAPAFAQYVPADDVPAAEATSGSPRSLFFPGSQEQQLPTNAAVALMENCIGPNTPVVQSIFGTPTTLASFVGHNQVSEVYGLTGLQKSFGKAASGRVAIFSQGGGFSEQDLADAAQCFGFKKPRTQITLGTGMPSRFVNIDSEATLDVQTVSAMLKNADAIHVVQVAPLPGAGAYIDGYTRALALNPLPHAITNSYGGCEPMSANRGMFRTLESVFQLAAVMGVTTAVASGDGGASTCQMLQAPKLLGALDNIAEINQRLASGQVPADQIADAEAAVALLSAEVAFFTPAVAYPRPTVSYPGSSPWALSVGGTSIDLNPDGTRRGEYVWNDLLYAGGGIENLVGTGGPSASFDSPWYQQPLTRADMRSVPDVAAMAGVGPSLPTVQNGAVMPGGGTSQASPLVAAGLALVSAREVQAGRPPVGFVNPWLYDTARRHPSTVYDVTVGENQFPVPYAPDSTNVPACCQANLGYDQASGLGVLNFDKVARHTRVR